MIDPGDLCGGGKQNLKLQSPSSALDRKKSGLKIAEPVGVKINVPRFVL